MEDRRPSPTCRRSPSPQRGVLTPSINFEDEYEDTVFAAPVEEEKDWKSVIVKKTTGHPTRSLPCTPQRRLVDERHKMIEEKLLSFDERDTAMLAQPTYGEGVLVENRHRWIQKEIIDQKSMQQASPSFDEGKYELTWVVKGIPQMSPHSTGHSLPRRKKNTICVNVVDEADEADESIEVVNVDEFIEIVEVVSSVEEAKQEAEVRKCLKSYPSDEVETPRNAPAKAFRALKSVQESVSQENDAKPSDFQVEMKPASSISICDTISMEDLEVPTGFPRACQQCSDLVSWEPPTAGEMLSMEVTVPNDSVEHFGGSSPIVGQENVNSSSPCTKTNNNHVVVALKSPVSSACGTPGSVGSRWAASEEQVANQLDRVLQQIHDQERQQVCTSIHENHVYDKNQNQINKNNDDDDDDGSNQSDDQHHSQAVQSIRQEIQQIELQQQLQQRPILLVDHLPPPRSSPVGAAALHPSVRVAVREDDDVAAEGSCGDDTTVYTEHDEWQYGPVVDHTPPLSRPPARMVTERSESLAVQSGRRSNHTGCSTSDDSSAESGNNNNHNDGSEAKESMQPAIEVPFVGNIETPHNRTPIGLKSIFVPTVPADFESFSQKFGESQDSLVKIPNSDKHRFRYKDEETPHTFPSPFDFDPVTSVEPTVWFDVLSEGALTVPASNLHETDDIGFDTWASIFCAESGSAADSIANRGDFGCADGTKSILSINTETEVQEVVIHVATAPIHDLFSHEGEQGHASDSQDDMTEGSACNGSSKTANEAALQRGCVSSLLSAVAYGDILTTDNDKTQSNGEVVIWVNEKSRMNDAKYSAAAASSSVKQNEGQACRQDTMAFFYSVEDENAAMLVPTVATEGAVFGDQNDSYQAEDTTEAPFEVVPASGDSIDTAKMKKDSTAESIFDIAPVFEYSPLGNASPEKCKPESSRADAYDNTEHKEDEDDRTDAINDDEKDPRHKNSHNMELVAHEGSHNAAVRASDQLKTEESESGLEDSAAGRTEKRNRAAIKKEGCKALEALIDPLNTLSLDNLTRDNNMTKSFVTSTSCAQKNHHVNTNSTTEQDACTVLMTKGVQEKIASMKSWDLLETKSTTDMYLDALKGDMFPAMSAPAHYSNNQLNALLEEDVNPGVASADGAVGLHSSLVQRFPFVFESFENLLEDTPAAEVETLTSDAVADDLKCTSLCNNQNTAPTTFDFPVNHKSGKPFFNVIRTDKRPESTEIAIGMSMHKTGAVELASEVSQAVGQSTYSIPGTLVSDNQAHVVATAKHEATLLAEADDEASLTSNVDMLSTGDQSSENGNVSFLSDQHSEYRKICTLAIKNESLDAATKITYTKRIQSASIASDIDNGNLEKAVVDRARRNKDRLKKAKACLLVDFPNLLKAKPSSVDPALQYKKQLMKARNLLTELAEVKQTVANTKTKLEKPYAFQSLAQSSSEESQSTAPKKFASLSSNNSNKNNMMDNKSADATDELALPISINCLAQCSIS